ncbi:MAG: glycosyltransferase family 1 protein, partial [Thermoleophilia bacterium]
GRLPCPCVMTLHDIILVRLANDYYSPTRARMYERRLLSKVNEADHIITVSGFSKKDLCDWSGIDPDKVSVVYNGVSGQFRKVTDPDTLDAVRRRYRLPKRFVFCVGSTEPRKNIRRAIEAFAQLRRVRADIQMVVAGVDYCRVTPGEAFDGLDLDGVVLAGYVQDVDLPAIYSMADLFFFPSLYEGFGLPPLEAMACGTPVITSSKSSIPEVVGDAAVLVDPRKPGEMAGALEMVLSSGGMREELISKGLARVSDFSWEKTAQQTREIYARIVNR